MNIDRRIDEKVYRAHLERVSRSFAFCIQQVRSPARDWIALAYLLCRLVDTIEDSAWENAQVQQDSYEFYKRCVDGPVDDAEIVKWAAGFSRSIPLGEIELLKDAPRFFVDFHALPTPIQGVMKSCVLAMTLGMGHMSRKFQRDKKFKLYSTHELNQYCFFVAGVVGELLTEIFSHTLPAWKVSHDSYLDAFHFGLFLQKVNILKDQLADEAQGRHFVPDREELRGGLSHHADRAFAYLLSIPESASDIRLFCAWSLFLGLASLPHIDRSWETRKVHKISRVETASVLAKVQLKVSSDQKLRELYESSRDTLTSSQRRTATVFEGKKWFAEIYRGKLTDDDFSKLGLC